MYHMTMPNTREQIDQEGLRRDRGETFEMGGAGGVFFYTKPQPFGREDVWEVDVSGIPLGLDETTDHFVGVASSRKAPSNWSAVAISPCVT